MNASMGDRLGAATSRGAFLASWLLMMACEAPLSTAPSDDAARAVAATGPKILVRLREPGDLTSGEFLLEGLATESLEPWRERSPDDPAWTGLLAVTQLEAGRSPEELPKLLGSTTLEGDVVVFTPRFRMSAGKSYHAVGAVIGSPASSASDRIEVTLSIPPKTSPSSAVVAAITPSAAVLPENLLRLYVHFSEPMSQGDVYDHVRLFDLTRGELVRDPWMAAEELWDPEGRRLTLLIHPGRIKRGLLPREVEGPVLSDGHIYVLRIAATLRDAQGRSLAREHEKLFRAGPEDRERPDTRSWQLSPPLAESRLPLEVRFPEPLDGALAKRLIWIVDATGDVVPGEATLERDESQWSFRPDETWRSGAYHLRVDERLEDLAGNNLGALFDVDVFEKVETPVVVTTDLGFEIRE